MTKKSLKELINTSEPAWPDVQSWLAQGTNQVEILPKEQKRAEQILHHLQITTRAPMGAVAYETGGLLFDSGWLRFLGSGSSRMQGNLYTWNGGMAQRITPLSGALIVAHDVVGGIFALNGGAFPGKPGNAYYFAPDTLEWEDMGYSYSALLQWAAAGDLNAFYENARWPGWQQEVKPLTGDQGILIYPPLWSAEGTIKNRSRNAVPMHELWGVMQDWRKQLVVSG